MNSASRNGPSIVVGGVPLHNMNVFQVLPSRLLAVLRVCRVCSHHCMKVSC